MPLDPARWERIQELFHQALELSEPERLMFLQSGCGGDTELLAEVLALLEEDAREALPLERNRAELVRAVFDGSVPPLRAVGPYRIVRVLGQGGMGVVYLAEREDLHSRVALKVLRDAALSPARRERFAREERTLAQLSHPSIARLYDADVLPDGTPYFVMEYVEGMPLTDYCRAHGCSIAERLQLFRSVCEAVQHAHGRAVIHRDVKPSNILVTGMGEVKLLDFGIAKQLESLEAATDPTQTGLRLMTPAYAAPEQVRGEPVGVYTDVYALGVLLYELLTGELPYDLRGCTPGEIEALIVTGEPERPSECAERAGAPGRRAVEQRQWKDLDVLCLTAMHKDPQRRYATVEALLRDVDRYLGEQPLEARPDTWRYRAGKFVRRNRQPVGAGALVGALLVGLVSFYTVRLAEQRDRAQTEAETAERISEYLIGLFEAASPFAAEGDTLTVHALLERGFERTELLAAQPAVKAQMLDVLGRVYMWIGDYPRSEELLRRALELRHSYGDPVDIAATTAHLGKLFSFSGQRDSSEIYLREALALRQHHLPPLHPDLGVNLSDLGSLLVDKGEYEAAGVVLRSALQIQRRGYDGPHADLAATLSHLGVNYFNQGRHQDAEPFYRQALEMDRAIFGSDHPTVATRLANLAIVSSLDDPVGADSLLSEALAVMHRRLGDDHYLTTYYRMQHASILRRAGEHERSEIAMRGVMATHERRFGADHPNTITAVYQLALALNDQGRYSEAEPLLRRAVEGFHASLGEQHFYSGASLANLGHALHRLGRPEEAERHFRAGLPILESSVPQGHASLLIHQSRFGALLVTLREFAEAEALLRTLLETPSAGAEHAFTREAATNLVKIYDAWGVPERAEAFRKLLAGEGL
jgi:eukaryotic-like serine/threonine-protein kinase